MGNYRLSIYARADLADIYEYGFRTWGREAARKYVDSLFEHFQQIASSPYRFPATHKFVKDCRRSVFKNNAIYYSVEGEDVEILAVLRHQDISRRFPYRI